MGSIFYVIGVALAGIAGYNHFQWYYIFISSIIMAIGYCIIRAPQIHGIVSRDGFIEIPKLLLIQVISYSIITAPVYFIAALFN